MSIEPSEVRIEFMLMVHGLGKFRIAVLVIALGLRFVPGDLPGQSVEIERIDVGISADGRSMVRIGAFNPIRAEIKNGPAAFTGSVEFVTDDPDGVEVVFAVPLRLSPGQVSTVAGLIAPGQLMPRIVAKVRDERGRSIGSSREVSLDGMTILEGSVRTIGLLGVASGIEQLPNVPGLANANRSGQKDIEVIPLAADRFPARPEALDSLDTIVLDTSDPSILNALDAGRSGALKTWVANGGHLVIVAASQAQAILDSSFREILPALPAGSERSFDLGALESLVGSTTPIVGAGRAMTVRRFEDMANRSGMAVDSASTNPVMVRGSSGFGRVTLIGMDVHDGPFAAWKDRPLFWVKALDLRRAVTDTAGGVAVNDPLKAGGSFFKTTSTDMAGIFRSAVDQFAGLRVVSFGFVILLILGYLLAIGPGDYLVVRYGLRKPEWTWLTFPLIVMTVTSSAYFMSYRMKGQALRVNKVDILDLDYVQKMSRGTTVAAVFSPANRDYDLSHNPVLIDVPGFSKNPPGVTANAGDRDDASEYRKLNWYDSPDDALGGSARPSSLSLSSSNYRYGGTNGTSMLMGLRIPIWSTRTVTGQWVRRALTLNPVRSDLARTGTDRVSGRLTNLLDEPLRDAILVYQSQVYDLGAIAPGASVTINPSRTQYLTNFLNRFFSEEKFQNQGPEWAAEARSKLPVLMMFHDSGPPEQRKYTNGPLKRLDLTGLLSLNRPMLVARIGRPGSVLSLTGATDMEQARIEQNTIIRCVLPLSVESTAAIAPISETRETLAAATDAPNASDH